ncbi:hypothetical protein VPH35_100664 [Triticum aestivum]
MAIAKEKRAWLAGGHGNGPLALVLLATMARVLEKHGRIRLKQKKPRRKQEAGILPLATATDTSPCCFYFPLPLPVPPHYNMQPRRSSRSSQPASSQPHRHPHPRPPEKEEETEEREEEASGGGERVPGWWCYERAGRVRGAGIGGGAGRLVRSSCFGVVGGRGGREAVRAGDRRAEDAAAGRRRRGQEDSGGFQGRRSFPGQREEGAQWP